VSRYRGDVRRTAGRLAGYSTAVMPALAAAGLIAALSGCSAADGLMSSVALPPSDTASAVADTQNQAASMPPEPPGSGGGQPSTLMVTGQQRAYLDALVAEGVHPSSDLLALSIGSYVCQAHAAGQSPQAVWDFVHPLVSSDVHNAHMSSMAPTSADVDASTASYIRIATERLC
jgi:hypothetical protein